MGAQLLVLAKIAAAAAPAVMGAIQGSKASKMARDAEAERKRQEKLLENLENSRQAIINPYANLGVATQAAEMKVEQVDQSLAAALDTLRATGGGSGAATQLAAQANKAKMQIASDIEKQEVQVQKMRAQGEQFVFQTREQREMQKMNRVAGLADAAYNQSLQYQSDAQAALMGGITSSIGMASYFLGGNIGGTKSTNTNTNTNLGLNTGTNINQNIVNPTNNNPAGGGLNDPNNPPAFMLNPVWNAVTQEWEDQ